MRRTFANFCYDNSRTIFTKLRWLEAKVRFSLLSRNYAVACRHTWGFFVDYSTLGNENVARNAGG